MSRLVRRGETSVNPPGRFRRGAIPATVLGWLLVVPLAPAHADTFDHALFVTDLARPATVIVGTTVEVVKNGGAAVRIAWTLPDVGTGRRPWHLRVGTQALTCLDDSAALVAGAGSTVSALRGSTVLSLAGAEFPVDASYYVRVCLPLGSGGYHATNQIEIRLVRLVIVARPPGVPLPGTPQITGTLAATPVRPRYVIGVTGRNFGDRPGRLLLQNGSVVRELSGLDWHSPAIAGRVPFIDTPPDRPAFLIVEGPDRARRPAWAVNFVATREVRVGPCGRVAVDSCSDEGDSNWCSSPDYPGGPSFAGYHSSLFIFDAAGERGVDQFSIPLLNGWRFHHLEYSHGNRDTPPNLAFRDRDSPRPHIRVSWRNPSGHATINYGFRLYIIGPAGVPSR